MNRCGGGSQRPAPVSQIGGIETQGGVHLQRVRSFCKGGGKTQRWGENAKTWGTIAKKN